MRFSLQHQVAKLNKARHSENRRRQWQTVLSLLVAVLIFHWLRLPATTLEYPTYCGLEEHAHTEECYAYVLDCPYERDGAEAGETDGFLISMTEDADGGYDAEYEELSFAEVIASHEEAVDPDAETHSAGHSYDPYDADEHQHQYATPGNYTEPVGSDSADSERSAAYAVVSRGADGQFGTVVSYADADSPDSVGVNSDGGAGSQDFEGMNPAGDAGIENPADDMADPAIMNGDIGTAAAQAEDNADTLSGPDGTINDEADRVLDAFGFEDMASAPDGGADNAAGGDAAADDTAPLDIAPMDAAPIEGPVDDFAATDSAAPEAHVHTEACYKKILICGQVEHVHGLICYANPEADVEDEALIEDLFPAFEEGNYSDSYDYFAALAAFQQDYQESVRNYRYEIGEDGSETIRGYTRYGAWADDAYTSDWADAFVGFTAEYAGLDIDTFDMDPCNWVQNLVDAGLYQEVEQVFYLDTEEELAAELSPGRLVILDADGDFEPDHIGILTAANASRRRITLILGNIDGRVKEVRLDLDDLAILGFALLPETEEALERNAAKLAQFVTTDEFENDETPDEAGFEDESFDPEDETAYTWFDPENPDGMTEVDPDLITEGSDSPKETEILTSETSFLDGHLETILDDYTIRLEADPAAGIPEDARFVIRKIESGTAYDQYKEEAFAAVADLIDIPERKTAEKKADTLEDAAGEDEAAGDETENGLRLLSLMDLGIRTADGSEIEPSDRVRVQIELPKELQSSSEIYVVHFRAEDIPVSGAARSASGKQARSLFAVNARTADALSASALDNRDEDPLSLSVLPTLSSILEDESTLLEIDTDTEDPKTAADTKDYSTDTDNWDTAGFDISFPDGAYTVEILDADYTLGALSFYTDSFSVYAVVGTTIEKTVLAGDGYNYKISVTYGAEAGFPDGAELKVEEILPDAGEDSGEAGNSGTGQDDENEPSVYARSYEEYVAYTEDALGWEADSASYARVFDISIVDGKGEKIQPAAGSTVDVRIALADANDGKLNVVHFADEANTGDVMESATNEQTVSFAADSFSAYAIVQGPSSLPIGWYKVSSIAELMEKGSVGLYIGHKDGYYYGNTLVSDGSRTGIAKTKPAQSYPGSGAAKYYFEQAEGNENQVYVYCYAADGTTKQYVYNGGNNSLSFAANEEDKTAFTVTQNSDGSFKFNHGAWYWNMQGGASGTRFCSYNSANDGNNEVYIWFYDEVTSDPYDLDGKSYGLMNWNGSVTGRAMMAESTTANAMDAKSLIVMSKLNNSGQLFVPNDSDITMWTFEWAEDDLYYLTATVEGTTQYLQISSSGLSLTGTKDDSCKIQVIPGTGANAGQICLKAANKTLIYSGSLESGFSVGGGAGSEWLYLVNLSELTTDYFMTYTASKISVSDTSVKNGSHVIVYTRTWNDTTKKYEFYAIDSDGSLVRCYENGDSIQWIGGLLNNMLWDFVEYYWEGTSDPNYYYELFNEYSEKYLAPQVTDGQILSGETIGINMNGRRNGYYYSNIVAWDDTYYAYAGLKADMNTGKIVSCPLAEADDFYFAIVQDLPVDDTLNTVPTIDHTKYGITMKIKDFENRSQMSSFLGSDSGGAVYTTDPGLLSTKLGDDGYPVVTQSGTSLGQLYSGSYDVNKLFISSTYEASGYYEFDSTQNFASLQGKEFKVYQQLGTTNEGRNTLKHGQFLPFNDIEAGRFSTNNRYNLYSATGSPLPDSDPRKYEQLYVTTQAANYYYGVELEASFTQTANGKDDWNHDIIYEFTGDDDFWLYVNGELVIDLGGIHSALGGSVNFSTGKVVVNGTETTLLETFRNNYMNREGITDANDPSVQEYLKQYFDYDEDTGTFSEIFTEYSTNTMRIFYMERGAGAANLHMRFNLASVRPGHVFLSKELKGVDTSESVLAEFPYQIYYKKENDETEYLLDHENPLHISVSYKDTTTPVPYRGSITIDEIEYQSVFLLKPGETADIAVPDEAISYRIVECGVSTEVYSSVSVKEDSVSGNTPKDSEGRDVSGREDYTLDYKSTSERPRVTYENTVDPDALHSLNITKNLYKEDGQTVISNDDTEFSFRLYLAAEFAKDIDDDAAYMQAYYVKDPNNNYCKWDPTNKRFVSLEKADFASLSEEEKTQAVFHTSMNGAISKIPANYTVEIRNLLAGTQYKVVERPYEIPDGYSFQKYIQNGTVSDHPAAAGVTEAIQPNRDETIVVCNVRGWGLRVNKIWSDESYMESRDPAYFAVFTDDGNGKLTLVPSTRTVKDENNEDTIVYLAKDEYGNDAYTVRQLTYGDNSIYWYFPVLPVSTASDLASYVIREVELTNPTIGANGNVTAYTDLAVKNGGDEIQLAGKQKGDSSPGSFTYKVQYETGTVEDGAQVRVDKVGNTRPGIVLKKTDWRGNPLSGATFELRDSSNNLIGEFTSDENGDISTAFLSNDVDYTLAETKAPQGYQGIPAVIEISQNAENVSIGGIDEAYFTFIQGTGLETSLTIKNRPFTLQAVKKDSDSNSPMDGVTFSLYKQQTVNGVTSMIPVTDFESITTEHGGAIPGINNTLAAGTYALKETGTLTGYEILNGDIYFSISSTGVVTLGAHPDGVELSAEAASTTGDGNATGAIYYEMTIFNAQKKKVSFQIVDIADISRVLEGAVFDLYAVAGENGSETRVTPALYTGLKSNSEGMLADNSGNTVFDLPVGKYQLLETAAPSGYNMKEAPVTVTVSANDVSYDEGTNISRDGTGKTYDAVSKVYTLKISNSTGYELPSTGGPGTNLIYLLGIILTAFAGAGLVMQKKRRRTE